MLDHDDMGLHRKLPDGRVLRVEERTFGKAGVGLASDARTPFYEDFW